MSDQMNTPKRKAWAAWLALIGGSVGLHRFYLYGGRDRLAWLHPVPTLAGLVGLWRFRTLGQEDLWAAILLPVLGAMLAIGAGSAIYLGLRSDERWQAQFNPHSPAQSTGWAPVLAAIAGLLLGGTALMSAIVFAAQRYFELQS